MGKRRRRDGGTCTPPKPLPIRDFVDAATEAFALKMQFGRAFVAEELDAAGDLVSGWALTGDDHSLDDVVSLLLAGDRPAPGGGVLLVTATTDEHVEELRPDDVATWGRLRARLDAGGWTLIDWILVGDDKLRSMHFATGDGAEVWPWRVG